MVHARGGEAMKGQLSFRKFFRRHSDSIVAISLLVYSVLIVLYTKDALMLGGALLWLLMIHRWLVGSWPV